MSYLTAIIYGIIQGLSEFLPVSSSGHLALLPHVMKVEDPGVSFDLMMHLGTAIAVMIYFRSEIMSYLKTINLKLIDLSYHQETTWFVRNFLLTTMVSVVMILVLLPFSKMARTPNVIMFNLCFFGVLLWLSDVFHQKRKVFLADIMTKGLQWQMCVSIGLAQAMAIFPGVSRSGITLTAALFLGMNRIDAGKFSFLLSLPIILCGILKDIPELIEHGSTKVEFGVLLMGVVSSFLVGLLTIHFFMRLIAKVELKYFAFYRFLIALILGFTL